MFGFIPHRMLGFNIYLIIGTQLIPNLDKECSKLPKTTTSLGYLCPTCNDQIIPSGNDNSLIANQIRTNLGGLDWFKACQVLKVTPEVVEVKSPEVVQVRREWEKFI